VNRKLLRSPAALFEEIVNGWALPLTLALSKEVEMIDWDRVTELQHEIGEDDFLEVGRLFLTEMQRKLEDMAVASVRDAADFHYLRGSATNLGLAEFAELCGAAEGAAKNGGTPEFEPIRDSFDRAAAEIAALFEG